MLRDSRTTLLGRCRQLKAGGKSLAERALRSVQPGPRAWNGAAVGVVLATALVLLLYFSGLVLSTGPALGPFLAFMLLLSVATLAGAMARLILSLVMLLPSAYRWSLFVCSAPLVLLFMRVDGPATMLLLVLVVVAPGSLIGAGVWVLLRGGMHDTTRVQKSIAVSGLVVGLAAAAFVIVWTARDGFAAKPYDNAAAQAGAAIAQLAADDPSLPGDHDVLTLTYGSGQDRHRREYGTDVDIVTQPVDGSPFIEQWDGWSGWARTRYWGFDSSALPIQGRVWYPDGAGPFPLVLVVHGNHSMEDYSDPGYDYLGELLAGRGFILASVDENFLNSSVGDLLSGMDGGLDEENDARGWLLLEHLRTWTAWNRDSANPFYDKVDLDRIGLIGHSRGGEAVAVAAAFNRLPYYPDDATVQFDYDFDIRAVVAIAPVDGQYRPAERGTPIENVNYFVMHGANDGDVSSFSGLSQYERVEFADGRYWFKAALYALGANHGQFNTTWGRSDAGEPYGRFLNLRPIMPAEQQEQIAKVYVSAFLEASLRGDTTYISLFRDHRAASDWLPETVYLHQFEDTRSRFVARFEEDIDVTTGTLPGTQLSQEHLTLWREQRVRLKRRFTETSAVFIGWDSAGTDTAYYAVSLPAPGTPGSERLRLALVPSGTLVFDLADADENPNPNHDSADEAGDLTGADSAGAADVENADDTMLASDLADVEGDEEDDDETATEPLDFTIELTDAAGRMARLPLATFSLLQPQLKVDVAKSGLFDSDEKSEIVFQTFVFPLNSFLVHNPDLELSELRRIRLVFDRSPRGAVVLDNVGFRR